MNALVRFLEELIRRREFAWGYQVAVVTDGTVLLDAAGGVDALGRPMAPDSFVAMYCSAKSLCAIAAAKLISDLEISLDDRVGDLLPACSDFVASTRIEDLLSHHSGIARPTTFEAATLPPHERLFQASRCEPIAPPLGDNESLYTEASEWLLLGACLAAAAGLPLTEFMQSRILAPAGIEQDFVLSGSPSERCRIGVALGNQRPRPLLLELSNCFSFETNPGYGGYSTMRGQALLLDALRGATIGGVNPVGLDQRVSQAIISAQPVRSDRAFRKQCAYGLGFMVQLASFGFGAALSPNAFGQAGLTGMVTVACDPETGVSSAIYLNGLLADVESVRTLREEVWRQVHEVNWIATSIDAAP